MLSFKKFLLEQELLLCGGNVQIDTQSADRIDLQQINRTEIVKVLNNGLGLINNAFEKSFGLSLWNEKLFKSKEFLSGSAFHFFDLQTIDDEEFVKTKSTVGDVDTQVNGLMSPMIKEFLDSSKGKTFGPLTLIGYKPSGGQYITLWKLPEFNINVQIDLELVDFDDSGNPTPWSQFSHSSSWDDLKEGIKGVFSKLLYSSLTAPKAKKIIVKAKTARGKDQIITKSELSFSVLKGLRNKYEPILDSSGTHIHENGLPTYRELSTAESTNITDLKMIFNIFFGQIPTATELKQMNSFVGTLDLIKQYMSSNINTITDKFVDKLWAPGAQALYRGDPAHDLSDKSAALNLLCTTFGLNFKQYEDQMINYYKNYK